MNGTNVEVDYLTVAVAIISFIFCYVFFCILNKGPKTRNQRFVDKCKKNRTYTQGHAVSSQFIRGDDESSSSTHRANSRRVKYEYEVAGKIYHKVFTFKSPGRAGVRYPQSITIYYKKGNPRKADIFKGEAKAGSYLLAFVLPAVLTFIAHKFF